MMKTATADTVMDEGNNAIENCITERFFWCILTLVHLL